MTNAIFDESTGVYRVNNSDGTFDTYTPAQYLEKFGTEPEIEEEEADVVMGTQTETDDNEVGVEKQTFVDSIMDGSVRPTEEEMRTMPKATLGEVTDENK